MSRRRQRNLSIDFTPLIDVLFMLVIFLVLTASFGTGRIVVNLPQGDAIRQERAALTVTVRRDGALLWGETPVEREELVALARDAAARKEDILVAGDREAPYGTVAEVLDLLRQSGVESAALAMQGGGER
ncbi:MAG TPA: biopolymer transporter ExbD [Synergistaceae bacterium]|nr:biopolymer transporter ExbD [Synergistaceae bacterium]